MAIFSKKKTQAKGKAAQPVAQDTTPKERQMYIPRYAARDGLIGAPTGFKAEEQEAFRQAYQRRMSREMSESQWSLPNPKLSPRLSRNSSSMSLDTTLASSASSRPNPFATPNMTRPSSYQSLPHILQENPMPAVPQQYASHVPSLSGGHFSRSSSYNQLQPQHVPSFNPQPGRPKMSSQRQSFAPSASPLGRTPEASNENSPVDSPDNSGTPSAASSVSGEAVEIPTKVDSPAQYMIDRSYPSDPRRYEPTQETPRSYFAHPTKPAPVATAAPVTVQPKQKRFSFMRKSNAVAAH